MVDISEQLDSLVEGLGVDNLALLALQNKILSRQAWLCEVLCDSYAVTFLIEAKTEDEAYKQLLGMCLPKDRLINIIKVTKKVTRI
jgi:hypothetical protein